MNDFILDQLIRTNIESDHLIALIYLAEDTYFDSKLRVPIGKQLISIAAALKNSEKPNIDKAVWSAMRRGFSLVNDTNLVLPFLDDKGKVDTRCVALKCLATMQHQTPNASKEIQTKVHDIAKKFLDPNVFRGGENAAIASHAIIALAAMKAPELANALEMAQKLNRKWLNRFIDDALVPFCERPDNHNQDHLHQA